MPKMFTEDKAMVILTGMYFIDFRKNTKPNAQIKHKRMVPKKSPTEAEGLMICLTSIFEIATIAQSNPKNKDAKIPLKNTRYG